MHAPEETVAARRDDQHFNFDIVLDGIENLVDDPAADAFYAAGCDDATLAVINSVTRLSFTRRANSLEDAVLSAVRDVLKVVRSFPHIRIVRLEIPTYRFLQSLEAILANWPDVPSSLGLLEDVLNAFEQQERGSKTPSYS